MSKFIKTDFHLHTCYSDNQDRMQPEEFATLARAAGYAAIGFCDHHHNLTQNSWQALRTAAQKLAAPDLLVNTGYEATFVTGHMCVLDKTEFDGATALACERQMWLPSNLRVVAHPDNNSCAWRLPLPVDAAAVEIINGGQDLYAFRPTSPCSGLLTYQTYLLLNHPIAAFAQSDCHARAMFGRVWTGMWLADGQPLSWEAVHSAIAERRTFAAMGDISLDVWCEEENGQPVLHWQGAEGAEITIYCADLPVAYLDSDAARAGSYWPDRNGYYWLLVKRDLAWAVSSPCWVEPRPADRSQAVAVRRALLGDSVILRQADLLKRRLEQLAAYAPDWPASPFPVQRYIDWLSSQLPERWTAAEFGSEPDELRRRALLRLPYAQSIAGAVLEDVVRQHYRARLGEQAGIPLLIAPQPAAGGGALQFMLDVPRSWAGVAVSDGAGKPLAALAMAVDGERDPINGPRTRYQMGEIITWLRSGEMHEYVLVAPAITRSGPAVSVQFDLYLARLAWQAAPWPELAAELERLQSDPEVTDFYVSIRMPRRYGVLLQADILPDPVLIMAHNAAGSAAEQAVLPADFFADTLDAADILGSGLAVQIS